MEPYIMTVWLFCSIHIIYGASLYKQDSTEKTFDANRRFRRATNIVKRTISFPTFESEAVGRELQHNGNPVFLSTIQRQQGVYVESVSSEATFNEIMENIYELREQKWVLQRDTVVNSVSFNVEAANMIRDSNSADKFYENIVTLYTTKLINTEVNDMMRQYRTHAESPFGPYALILNVVLSQWHTLQTYEYTTYRGVNFTTESYTVNTIFTWTAFTSSSKDLQEACRFAGKALFMISNDGVSDWRPKSVKQFSHFKDESEYLYPATAIFKVTSVQTGACGIPNMKVIHIDLQEDPILTTDKDLTLTTDKDLTQTTVEDQPSTTDRDPNTTTMIGSSTIGFTAIAASVATALMFIIVC